MNVVTNEQTDKYIGFSCSQCTKYMLGNFPNTFRCCRRSFNLLSLTSNNKNSQRSLRSRIKCHSSATQPVWRKRKLSRGNSSLAEELCYTLLFQFAFTPHSTDQCVHSIFAKKVKASEKIFLKKHVNKWHIYQANCTMWEISYIQIFSLYSQYRKFFLYYKWL